MVQQRGKRGNSGNSNPPEDKAQLWQRRMQAFAASGLTRRAFCTREGLSLSSFDYWRRRHLETARASGVAATGGGARPALAKPKGVAPSKKASPLTLLPLTIDAPQRGAALLLRGPGGWCLELPTGVEAAWLATLLRELP